MNENFTGDSLSKDIRQFTVLKTKINVNFSIFVRCRTEAKEINNPVTSERTKKEDVKKS